MWKWFLLLVLALPLSAQAHTIRLAWDCRQDLDPSVAGFNMYRSEGCTNDYTKINPLMIPSSSLAYDDTGVSLGRVYCYRVTAQSALGMESTPSNTVRFSLQEPQAPQNLHGEVSQSVSPRRSPPPKH